MLVHCLRRINRVLQRLVPRIRGVRMGRIGSLEKQRSAGLAGLEVFIGLTKMY